MMPKRRFSDEEIIEIYEKYYLNGLSTIKIAEIYGVSSSLINKWFARLGLKMRSNKINSKIYQANDYYFDEINTPEKAYWLGFMYADGYILSDCNKIGITLAIKDREHLESFNKCLNSNYPIKEYCHNTSYKKDTRYCKVIISSDKLHEDLIKHGVLKNKTNILEPPKIDYNLIRYFILGYFDGDGSIYFNKSRSPFYNISFCATDSMCEFINEYLLENNLINKKCEPIKRKEGQIVSCIKFGGNIQVTRIMEHLYGEIDKSIVLKRKYDLYINCKNRIFI